MDNEIFIATGDVVGGFLVIGPVVLKTDKAFVAKNIGQASGVLRRCGPLVLVEVDDLRVDGVRATGPGADDFLQEFVGKVVPDGALVAEADSQLGSGFVDGTQLKRKAFPVGDEVVFKFRKIESRATAVIVFYQVVYFSVLGGVGVEVEAEVELLLVLGTEGKGVFSVFSALGDQKVVIYGLVLGIAVGYIDLVSIGFLHGVYEVALIAQKGLLAPKTNIFPQVLVGGGNGFVVVGFDVTEGDALGKGQEIVVQPSGGVGTNGVVFVVKNTFVLIVIGKSQFDKIAFLSVIEHQYQSKLFYVESP